MPDPNNNDDLPLIQLDEEDRRGYQQKQKPTTKAEQTKGASTKPMQAKQSKPSSAVAIVALLLALASSCAAAFLFIQLQQQLEVAAGAEDRIAELENKLSATGEEIGESTVALQIKVTELTNKTNELWEQMDKLWASAWRRNQKDIDDLKTNMNDQFSSVKGTLSKTSATAKSNSQSIADARVLVENLTSEVLSVNVQLERISANHGATSRDLKSTAEKLSLLEQRNAALVNRINQLENEIRDLASRIAATTP